MISEVISIPKSDRTFQNTVHRLADAQGELFNNTKELSFPYLVGTTKALRDAASEAKQRLEEYEIEYFQRADIYAALTELKEKV